MADRVTLDLLAARDLATTALVSSGANAPNAASVTRGILDAELSDTATYGFLSLPTYCDHLLTGKVDGTAVPAVEQRTESSIGVDAGTGFAHPAIDAGLAVLVPAAYRQGVAGLAIANSYQWGLLGYHVRRIAEKGLVGMGFANAPGSMAPFGGAKAVVGTNPISFAVPGGPGRAAFVIDQSSSVIARTQLIQHAADGRSIPEGWALDGEGRPTTDPEAGLAGTMVPAGGYKGFSQALMVEVMAAALSGSNLGLDASSFTTTKGGPPRTGQFFLALSPPSYGGDGFSGSIDRLTNAIASQEGSRLPGSRRASARERVATEGISLSPDLYERILGYAAAGDEGSRRLSPDS